MQDNPEDIQKFLENIPDQFNILEKGIDFKVQAEYVEYSHSFDRGELTEKETHALGNILFRQETPFEVKKKALALLAHLGTILAFRIIEKYFKNPDKDLEQWAALALQECKMFLESAIMDISTGFVSSGLGGLANRMRYYFLLLPLTDKLFTPTQSEIIRDELQLVCKELNCILETTNFSGNYVGMTILVPMDVAVGTVIETGIKNCNELGEFVFQHYYVANTNIPDESEITDIIKIVTAD
ncbi:MAG: hypothetical protein Q8R96_06880 [Bacteroidota bacterium]|nr:hypothetical protein [Bacteroidota bacterium]